MNRTSFRPAAALALAIPLLLAAAPARAARDGFGRGGGSSAVHGAPSRSGGRGVWPGLAGRRRFEAGFGYGLFPYGADGLPYGPYGDADAGPWLPPFPAGGPLPPGLQAAPGPLFAPAGPPAQACVPAAAPGMPNVIYPSTGAPPTCG